MCGRYASSRKPEDLVEEFEVDANMVKESLQPDYNVAPTKDVYAVMDRVPRDAPKDTAAERRLTTVRWGLIPSWAKDIAIGNRMINARIETLAEKPAFKRALKKRRCLLPADGYYEWYPTEQLGKSGKPLKQPFYLHPKSGGVLPLAGLYEFWRDKEAADDDPDAWLVTFTIITTSATDDVGHVHDRMPMTVAPERWKDWLDPRLNDGDAVRELMAPPAEGTLEIYPISTQVNNVKNNGPELRDPMPIEETALGESE
ncbi:MAG TPA: SOS response-associated peptidase [Nocardioidaceae bacterium]|nr:SOS response-associated peptidase [Nocardioidaceae bacterium]